MGTQNDQPLLVIVEYEPVETHTQMRPFCSSSSCNCHDDDDLVQAQITDPVMDGLLTPDEAIRLYWNRQIV